MKWILIWVVLYSGSITSGSAEFNSREYCESGKQEILAMRDRSAAICVPKG